MEILSALIAALCLGLHNAIAKKPLQSTTPSKLFFYRELVLVLMMLPVLILEKSEANLQEALIQKNLLISIFAGFVGYFVVVFLYKGIKIGNPGLIGAITNSYLPGVMVLAYFFLDETLNPAFFPKATLVVLGILLISIPKGLFEKQNTKGVKYGLFAMLIYCVMFILFKPATVILGAVLASFVMRLAGFLTVGGALIIMKKGFSFPKKEILVTILLGFLMTLTIFGIGFSLQYSGKNLGLIIAIIGSSPLVTLVYSNFVYRMKVSFKQLIGIFITIIGVVLLAIN